VPAGHRPRQRLKQVMMGVDEARDHDVAGAINHRVSGCRQLRRRTDGLDHAVARKHGTIRDLAVGVVKCGDNGRMSEKERRHEALSP
jgi:hypothetical protein